MFFKIAQTIDPHFPHQHRLQAGLYLMTDEGWTAHQHNYIKGYADQSFESEEARGNFLLIQDHAGDGVNIKWGAQRSCPIFYSQASTIISNIPDQGLEVLDYNQSLHINAKGTIEISSTPYTMPKLHHDRGQLEAEICSFIQAKFAELDQVRADQKLYVFISGGLDTMTLLSYLLHQRLPFEPCFEEQSRPSAFLLGHPAIQQNFWGYRQIHHWDHPSLLVSGACGDSVFLREPVLATLALMSKGVDLASEIQNTGGDFYAKKFLTRPSNWQAIVETQKRYAQHHDLMAELRVRFLFDYQHWHLGQTMTFTPFNDIRLFDLILEQEASVILNQVLHGDIQRCVIQSLMPECLKFLSDEKNTHQSQNLGLLKEWLLNY